MTLNEIKQEIQNNDVVLFMKGTPTFPQCGFSAHVISILTDEGVSYTSHDVLQNDDLRTNIKEFSDWPTIPQLYVRGKFIGGADIVHEMYDKGELSNILNPRSSSWGDASTTITME